MDWACCTWHPVSRQLCDEEGARLQDLIIPGEQLTAIKEAPLLLKPVRWCSFKTGSPLLLSSKIEVARLPLLNVSSVVLSQAV